MQRNSSNYNYSIDDNDMDEADQQQQLYHHQQHQSSEQQQPSYSSSSNNTPGSPTLAELQANCYWNKAIDPASGRTYYYDIRTRQTQWEKPREIRAIEKRIKKDQRIKDEMFFREMERNLLASLARGECIPRRTTTTGSQLNDDDDEEEVTENDTRRKVTNNSNTSKNAMGSGGSSSTNATSSETGSSSTSSGRIRTISCMNEHLLAQIQQPIPLQRVNTGNSMSKSFEGRPPLPSRPTGTTATSTAAPMMISSNNGSTLQQPLISNQNLIDRNGSVAASANTNNSNPSENGMYLNSHNYNDFSNINQQHILPYGVEHADYDDDDLKLSPEENPRKHLDDDLRGEDLLDGALILADLEMSDDEEGDDNNALLECIDGTFSDANGSIHGPSAPSSMEKPLISIHPTATKKLDSNGIVPLSHIRRNTAGEGSLLTSHMKGGTMEKPDIDGTIHVVCGVIRAHIEQSIQEHRIHSAVAPPNSTNINLNIFRDDYEQSFNETTTSSHQQQQQQLHPQQRQKLNSRTGNISGSNGTIPTLDEIKEFYREFYQRSQMEFDAIIMSLIYVERLIKCTNGALMPTPYNWASVVFSCMVLASKVWDDLSMWNIDFSNVSVNSGVLSSFSLKRINELELSVLACLNFAVAISGSEYAKYYYLLRSMMIRGGLLDPFVAANQQQLSTDTTNRLQDRTNHYQDTIIVPTTTNNNSNHYYHFHHHHTTTTNNDDTNNPRRRVRSVDWSL